VEIPNRRDSHFPTAPTACGARKAKAVTELGLPPDFPSPGVEQNGALGKNLTKHRIGGQLRVCPSPALGGPPPGCRRAGHGARHGSGIDGVWTSPKPFQEQEGGMVLGIILCFSALSWKDRRRCRQGGGARTGVGIARGGSCRTAVTGAAEERSMAGRRAGEQNPLKGPQALEKCHDNPGQTVAGPSEANDKNPVKPGALHIPAQSRKRIAGSVAGTV
jgi:hypothetical protein